jgi:hypothetical protein
MFLALLQASSPITTAAAGVGDSYDFYSVRLNPINDLVGISINEHFANPGCIWRS